MAPGDNGPDFVVCGDNSLTYLLVCRLLENQASVAVVLPNLEQGHGPLLAELAELHAVRLVESERPDEVALRKAGVADARALALVDRDDVNNIHTGLRAYEINPNLRLVVRMFNTGLGFRIRTLFSDCVVLSMSEMAAPSFVAAALDEQELGYIRLADRTLYIADPASVPGGRVVCGLAGARPAAGAVTAAKGDVRVLPAGEEGAQRVIAVNRHGPHPSEGVLFRLWQRIRYLLRDNLIRWVIALIGIIAVCSVLLAVFAPGGWTTAVYEILLDTAGNAEPDHTLSSLEKWLQIVVTFAGLALLAVVTAIAVDTAIRARLADHPGPDPALLSDHVVVVGLGNVGMRVVEQLRDLGVRVVALDSDEHARGIGLARSLGVPIVFGDVTWEDTLRSVRLDRARALLLLTSSDAVNLEAALLGRAYREDLRVVLRLSDDDLAERVEANVGLAASRSVSRLAAESFAAAMAERGVIATMSFDDATLMVADVPIATDSALVGRPIGEANRADAAQVVALQSRVGAELEWLPPGQQLLRPNNRLVVVATRAGLGDLLARSGTANFVI